MKISQVRSNCVHSCTQFKTTRNAVSFEISQKTPLKTSKKLCTVYCVHYPKTYTIHSTSVLSVFLNKKLCTFFSIVHSTQYTVQKPAKTERKRRFIFSRFPVLAKKRPQRTVSCSFSAVKRAGLRSERVRRVLPRVLGLPADIACGISPVCLGEWLLA